jgi:nucleoside-diphosphate-sugar epimerase
MTPIPFPYKTALVIGGAGFIGSHLVDALLTEGVAVATLDNYSWGLPANLEEARRRSGAHLANFGEHLCDITNRIPDPFSPYDVVFHLAANHMGASMKDPARDAEVNLMGMYNVMDFCRRCGAKKLVYASTGSVYGSYRWRTLTEDLACNPVSYYGIHKLAAEKAALLYGKLNGLDVTALRFFNVYGPRQRSDDVGGGVVSVFCRRVLEGLPLTIHGDGSQTRAFTYVSDIVDACLLAAKHPATRSDVFNVGSPNPFSILTLATTLKELAGDHQPFEHGERRAGDVDTFFVDSSKIGQLGHEFRVPFAQGLAQTFAWHKEQGE